MEANEKWKKLCATPEGIKYIAGPLENINIKIVFKYNYVSSKVTGSVASRRSNLR